MTDLLVETLMLGLAAYRITRLIVKDSIIDGPRSWLTKRLPAKPAELLECPWCMGVWVAFATVWVVMQFVSVPLPWLQATAAAAIVGIISRAVDE